MLLVGTVSNVDNFGAFVDVGVHQDGLVHVSALSNRFVKDPREVVKAGDVVKVKVVEVDLERKRIALTMRLDDAPREAASGRDAGQGGRREGRAQTPRGEGKKPSPHPGQDARGRGGKPSPEPRPGSQPAPAGGAMAEALARALKRG
jgi:uncharacterized protein